MTRKSHRVLLLNAADQVVVERNYDDYSRAEREYEAQVQVARRLGDASEGWTIQLWHAGNASRFACRTTHV